MSYATVTVNPPNTTLPVDYTHTIDYFEKGIDEQGPFFRVHYHISNWADSDTFINALLGISNLTGSTSSGTVVKNSPHQHPLSPNLFCRSAKARGASKPLLNSAGLPAYTADAIIEAEYRAPTSIGYDYTPNGNASIDPTNPLVFCTQRVKLTTETYLIPKQTMYYKSGTGAPSAGNSTGQPFRLFVPVTYLDLTFHKLPYIPLAAARALRARVNNATFLGGAAGCVLFKDAEVQREWSADGSVVQEVHMLFAERDSSQKWNQLPDTDLNWYDIVAGSGSGTTTPYPTADLSPLVQL